MEKEENTYRTIDERLNPKKEITFCRRCLMPNTRPWGEFEDGLCGACRFDDKKNNEIDWMVKELELRNILSESRINGDYDVLVPVSGGKDGSYTAYQMKNKYGCKVLTATLAPPMWSGIGLRNLKRFSRFTGIPNILITPPYDEYRAINWKGMTEMGYPKRGFVAGLVPSMMRIAKAFNIPIIMWGEHEEEYEGERDVHNKGSIITFDDFMNSDDFCGADPNEFLKDIKGDTSFWQMPENMPNNLTQMHFSRFEKWNSKKHLQIAMEKCGLQPRSSFSPGTYTNSCQIDDDLYTFFMYMAFVKFGFSRVTNDVGIDCRQNGMSKHEAIIKLEEYEHDLPMSSYNDAKWYFDKTGPELWQAINQWHNKELLDYTPNNWFQQFKWKPELLQKRRDIAHGKGSQ